MLALSLLRVAIIVACFKSRDPYIIAFRFNVSPKVFLVFVTWIRDKIISILPVGILDFALDIIS